MQEPCHKFDEYWIAVFWVLRLPSLPLWCLISSSISCLCLIRVCTRYPLDVTGENPIFLHIPPLTLVMVGCPGVSIFLIVPLPWHGDRIQKFTLSYILDKSSQISRGGYSWSLIREVIESQPLVEKQSHLLQYLPSDLGTPNPREF